MLRHLFDHRYAELFAGVGVSLDELLIQAKLPPDLFRRKTISLTKEEYYRLMVALGKLMPNDDAVVRMATWNDMHTFSPPSFAAYCSTNAITCMERLSMYKRLVGPMMFRSYLKDNEFHIELAAIDEYAPLPEFLVELESAFLISLIRNATQRPIRPLRMTMLHQVRNQKLLDYWGCPVTVGERNIIVLSKADAERRFVSENEDLWNFFEPELKRRLRELETEDSICNRVGSALVEMLPGGKCRIEDVASKLCLSKRTMQRKLSLAGTSYQKQLNHTRKLLAINYVKDPTLRNDDIAFLLGYQDTNAFLRAFGTWMGQTVGKYRANH